jgi:hypothetical protein
MAILSLEFNLQHIILYTTPAPDGGNGENSETLEIHAMLKWLNGQEGLFGIDCKGIASFTLMELHENFVSR